MTLQSAGIGEGWHQAKSSRIFTNLRRSKDKKIKTIQQGHSLESYVGNLGHSLSSVFNITVAIESSHIFIEGHLSKLQLILFDLELVPLRIES